MQMKIGFAGGRGPVLWGPKLNAFRSLVGWFAAKAELVSITSHNIFHVSRFALRTRPIESLCLQCMHACLGGRCLSVGGGQLGPAVCTVQTK